MRDTVKLGLILMLICAVSAGSLSYVYGVTSKIIDERKALEVARALAVVLPSAQDFEKLTEEELADVKADARFSGIEEAYRGSADGEVRGVVAKVLTSGYGGKIALLVGVSSDLSVEGLEVLSHSETPGLGGEITKSAFRSQFAGKGSSGPLAVNKDGGEIVAISSATISSRAVVAGVNTVRDLTAALGVAGGAGR
ncbi:MAG: RnfABCDGE type electron transport complex subunit G [Bacillota bacterium]